MTRPMTARIVRQSRWRSGKHMTIESEVLALGVVLASVAALRSAWSP